MAFKFEPQKHFQMMSQPPLAPPPSVSPARLDMSQNSSQILRTNNLPSSTTAGSESSIFKAKNLKRKDSLTETPPAKKHIPPSPKRIPPSSVTESVNPSQIATRDGRILPNPARHLNGEITVENLTMLVKDLETFHNEFKERLSNLIQAENAAARAKILRDAAITGIEKFD